MRGGSPKIPSVFPLLVAGSHTRILEIRKHRLPDGRFVFAAPSCGLVGKRHTGLAAFDREIAWGLRPLPGLPHCRVCSLDMPPEPIGVEQRAGEAVLLQPLAQ